MIGPATAAILIEPFHGGRWSARGAPDFFLRALRKLCDQHGLLLVFDEVQPALAGPASCSDISIPGLRPIS